MSLAHRLDGPEDAPVLALSNSLGTTLALWDDQLPGLLPHCRVLRYDHPGHGRSPLGGAPITVESMADDFVELLDELGLERVSFCGLSLGGMVGMALTLRAPERVERLVLACTAAYLGPPEGWEKRAQIVRTAGLEAIADSVVARWFAPGFRAAEPETVVRFRDMLVATPPEGYAASCEALAHWDARESIRRVVAPTLIVVGAEDAATTIDDAEEMARAIPGSRVVTLAGAAHLANVEQPAAFTRALLDHVVTHPRSEEAA